MYCEELYKLHLVSRAWCEAMKSPIDQYWRQHIFAPRHCCTPEKLQTRSEINTPSPTPHHDDDWELISNDRMEIIITYPHVCTSPHCPISQEGWLVSNSHDYYFIHCQHSFCMWPWQPSMEQLFWYPIFNSHHCNSFEDWAPVDFIYGCPIFKWVTQTLTHDRVPVE